MALRRCGIRRGRRAKLARPLRDAMASATFDTKPCVVSHDADIVRDTRALSDRARCTMDCEKCRAKYGKMLCKTSLAAANDFAGLRSDRKQECAQFLGEPSRLGFSVRDLRVEKTFDVLEIFKR